MTAFLAALAPYVIVAASAGLICLGIGHWTAAKDAEGEVDAARAKAFDDGVATAWSLIGPAARVRAAHHLKLGHDAGRLFDAEEQRAMTSILPDDEQETA